MSSESSIHALSFINKWMVSSFILRNVSASNDQSCRNGNIFYQPCWQDLYLPSSQKGQFLPASRNTIVVGVVLVVPFLCSLPSPLRNFLRGVAPIKTNRSCLPLLKEFFGCSKLLKELRWSIHHLTHGVVKKKVLEGLGKLLHGSLKLRLDGHLMTQVLKFVHIPHHLEHMLSDGRVFIHFSNWYWPQRAHPNRLRKLLEHFLEILNNFDGSAHLMVSIL